VIAFIFMLVASVHNWWLQPLETKWIGHQPSMEVYTVKTEKCTPLLQSVLHDIIFHNLCVQITLKFLQCSCASKVCRSYPIMPNL